MATVGTRPIKDRAKSYENDPLRSYAESFFNVVRDLSDQGVELYTEAARAYSNPTYRDQLKDFFIKESYSSLDLTTPEAIEEHVNDMEALFLNDVEGVMTEATNMATVNPMIGFSVPMHKLILMNMVFDKGGIPKVVANAPQFTITMENNDVIKAELYPEIAPNSVNNFISLVKKGFYDGLIFHRVIEGFMIQGGCPQGTGTGGPGYSIKGEFAQNGFPNALKHETGVLSMARAMHPNSAGSQFFIMHEAAPHLDGSYAAFGKVVEGMDVVNKIAEADTDWNDRPLDPQVIKSMTVETFGVDYPEPETL